MKYVCNRVSEFSPVEWEWKCCKNLQVWSTNTWKLVKVGKTWVRLWLKLTEKSTSEDPKTRFCARVTTDFMAPLFLRVCLCSWENLQTLDTYLLYVAEKERIIASSQSWNPFHTPATLPACSRLWNRSLSRFEQPFPEERLLLVYNHPYSMDMNL